MLWDLLSAGKRSMSVIGEETVSAMVYLGILNETDERCQ